MEKRARETLAQELRDLAEQLAERAAVGETPEVTRPLRRLDEAIRALSKAWSGSNMGHQSRVYYAHFEIPPPGAHFDSEWGFLGTFQGTTGDWREYQFDDVVALVYEQARVASLDPVSDLAAQAEETWSNAQPEVVSILTTYLTGCEDELIEGLRADAEKVKSLAEGEATRGVVGPIGQKAYRDTTAVSEGLMVAPHQLAEAKVVTIRSRFRACSTLAKLAQRAASHIERLAATGHTAETEATSAKRVFIGHGGSHAWREFKDFLQDRLELPWEEFNRVPVAGTTNIARLKQMLGNAGIAFLIFTAEDETAEGAERARQNVVHEAGLFQARLGFERAIILWEEDCEPFSNLDGLQQIRFPRGQISACSEEVRRVLEREGFL